MSRRVYQVSSKRLLMPNSRPNQRATQSSAAQQRFSRTLLLATDLQQSILAELGSPNPIAYCPYGWQGSPREGRTQLGFNGQIKERSTGWYHLGNGHRVYNPVLMRFHSPDRLSPFGKGGVNPYAYCQGDPLNYTDPAGEFMVSVSPIIQRGLTVALHSVAPTLLVFGDKVSGVALQATRFSLAGSVVTVVGAVMQLAGYPVGGIVSAAGTTALLTGAATRGAVMLKTRYQNNVLWKTVRDNVKNILGLPDSAKPPKTPDPLATVTSETPAKTSGDIRDSK